MFIIKLMIYEKDQERSLSEGSKMSLSEGSKRVS